MERTVFDGFKSYDREVIPKDAPVVQREECRRAFYAGARLMLSLALDACCTTDDDEAERRLVALNAEVDGIVNDLRFK